MKSIIQKAIPVLFCLFLLPVFTIAAFSENRADFFIKSRTVVVFSDGSREEIYLVEYTFDEARGTRTGSKYKDHYSQSNELVWRVKLTGTFSYNGTTSSCTAASTTVTFYKSGWSVISENTTHSGNTASTSVILGRNVLGVIVPAAYVNLSLSCDKDGNLS